MRKTVDSELINLGGDIVLVLGDSNKRIRASKALLSSTSAYFRGLLGPRYAEGEAASAGRHVKLYGDDPAALTTMMKLLHKCQDFLVPLSTVELHDLAVVADKYGCTEALGPSLKKVFPDSGYGLTKPTVYTLISASYMLDHPGLFRIFTKSMLQDLRPTSGKSFPELAALCPRVPGAVWRKLILKTFSNATNTDPSPMIVLLESRRCRIREVLIEAIASLLGHPCPGGAIGCSASNNFVANRSRAINAHELISEHQSKSVVEVIQLLESVDLSKERYRYMHCNWVRESHQFVSKKTMKKWIAEIRGLLEPLCIDCIKAGRFEIGGGAECRIPH